MSTEEDECFDLALELPKKKKRKKKKKPLIDDDLDANNKSEYYDHLTRIYALMRRDNVIAVTRQKLPAPKLLFKNSYTIWENFGKFCQAVNRQETAIQTFINKELGLKSPSTIKSNGVLSMRGRVKTDQIESLIIKYVRAYVKCSQCSSITTTLKRDSSTRLTYVSCNNCNSNRYVDFSDKKLLMNLLSL